MTVEQPAFNVISSSKQTHYWHGFYLNDHSNDKYILSSTSFARMNFSGQCRVEGQAYDVRIHEKSISNKMYQR